MVRIPKKDVLLKKLNSKPKPKNFTVRDLDQLMAKCGCVKFQGGRGSGLKYVHSETNRVLTFDGPHPGNELYYYQIDKVKEFLKLIGELD